MVGVMTIFKTYFRKAANRTGERLTGRLGTGTGWNGVPHGTGWNQNQMEPEPELDGTGTRWNWNFTLTLGPGNSIFARFGPFGTRIRL